MKKLDSGISSFEKLRQEKRLYVDKTEYIWQLLEDGSASYFLSRPRRFGKSLTISTLKAIFEGRKELFEGLAIASKPYDWKAYPILHLSLGDYNPMNDTPERLNKYLVLKVSRIAKDLHIPPMDSDDPSAILGQLIDTLSSSGSQVVILVDEYDKPIVDNIKSPNIADIQRTLKGFYGVLKDRNAKERFLFITGVSKFSHVSLFSDLNNLIDITMNAQFATMLGYTQEELEANFPEYLAQAAANNNMSLEDCKAKVKEWYNGFRFHAKSQTVYNPVSIAKFLDSSEFNNYWFSTGTPTFLLELMRNKNFDLEQALTQPVSNFTFDAYDVNHLNPLAFLLQGGYLTIDHTESRYSKTNYYLRFPNLEVKNSFLTILISNYSDIEVGFIQGLISNLTQKIATGDVNGLMETMKVFFANVPYDLHLKNENNFQVLFFAIFMLLGLNITAESKTNEGRIDAVAVNGDFVFIFEFKLKKTAASALDQIKQRDYYRRYMNSNKRIFLIGASFSKKRGQILTWTSQEATK